MKKEVFNENFSNKIGEFFENWAGIFFIIIIVLMFLAFSSCSNDAKKRNEIMENYRIENYSGTREPLQRYSAESFMQEYQILIWEQDPNVQEISVLLEKCKAEKSKQCEIRNQIQRKLKFLEENQKSAIKKILINNWLDLLIYLNPCREDLIVPLGKKYRMTKDGLLLDEGQEM